MLVEASSLDFACHLKLGNLHFALVDRSYYIVSGLSLGFGPLSSVRPNFIISGLFTVAAVAQHWLWLLGRPRRASQSDQASAGFLYRRTDDRHGQ